MLKLSTLHREVIGLQVPYNLAVSIYKAVSSLAAAQMSVGEGNAAVELDCCMSFEDFCLLSQLMNSQSQAVIAAFTFYIIYSAVILEKAAAARAAPHLPPADIRVGSGSVAPYLSRDDFF